MSTLMEALRDAKPIVAAEAEDTSGPAPFYITQTLTVHADQLDSARKCLHAGIGLKLCETLSDGRAREVRWLEEVKPFAGAEGIVTITAAAVTLLTCASECQVGECVGLDRVWGYVNDGRYNGSEFQTEERLVCGRRFQIWRRLN